MKSETFKDKKKGPQKVIHLNLYTSALFKYLILSLNVSARCLQLTTKSMFCSSREHI